MTRSLLVRTLPALPCAILAAMSAWWIAGDLAGGGLWPADEILARKGHIKSKIW